MSHFSQDRSPGQSTKTNSIQALIQLTAIVLKHYLEKKIKAYFDRSDQIISCFQQIGRNSRCAILHQGLQLQQYLHCATNQNEMFLTCSLQWLQKRALLMPVKQWYVVIMVNAVVMLQLYICLISWHGFVLAIFSLVRCTVNNFRGR